MADTGYQGALTPLAGFGDFNTLQFAFRQAAARMHTATLVQVVRCTNSGTAAAVGFVDVQPLVNMLDGSGNAVPHGVLHSLPYLRIQGGANAVIIDPQAGDIGIAVFAERDISSVKNTKAQANPGSYRVFDMADGLYLGGMLNGTPTQYVQFSSAGIGIVSPTAVQVQAPTVEVTATTSATVTAPSISLGASGQSLFALVTSAFQALFNGHTHTSAASGSPTSIPNQTMGSSELTTTVKGG